MQSLRAWCLSAVLLAPALLAGPVGADEVAAPLTAGEAGLEARDLSSDLATLPRARALVGDVRKADAIQPALDEMNLAAEALASELEAGRSRRDTRALYEQLWLLRRELIERMRVLDVQLPEDDVRAFEARFRALSAFYSRR